jgi:hypothetical protein
MLLGSNLRRLFCTFQLLIYLELFCSLGAVMSTFFRRGHYRNGNWVEGHYVQRDIWDRSSYFHNVSERFQPEIKLDRSSFISPNAHCPICSQSVFYYQNQAGSKVWFDNLWPAWDKHPCLYDLEERTHHSIWSEGSIEAEKVAEKPAYSCRVLRIKSKSKIVFFKFIEDLGHTIKTSYHSISAGSKDKLNNNYFYTKSGDDIYFFDADNLDADKLNSSQFPTRELFFAFAKIGRFDFDKLKELKKYHEGVYRLQHHARQHMAAWLYENTK